MSKGSGRRPQKVSNEQMQDNWQRIFGAKGQDEKRQKDTDTSKQETKK